MMDAQLSRAVTLLKVPRVMDEILAEAKKAPTTRRVRVRSVPAKDHD
jgi:hypothetical protein